MKAKVIQFTISQNSEKILETFSKKYGTSKSNVVNRALEFLAGAYHKKIIISYELSDHEFKEQVKPEPEDCDYSEADYKKFIEDVERRKAQMKKQYEEHIGI